jgi:hypothetical protein
MKHRAVPPIFFLLAAILSLAGGAPVRAQAQTPPWTGIIAPSRAIDWSQAGVPGGIPVRTTICASIAPEGSSSAPVAPTDINAAIASCPAGEVVYLQPGNFYFSSGIDFANHSNVTLRGAGADQTFLFFSAPGGCDGFNADVCVENGTNTWNASTPSSGGYTQANWTAGYAPGTTQITLDNTSGIVPGKTLLILDQLNDSNTDNGGIWVNDTNGVAEDDNPSGGYRSGRAQEQVVLATAVSGSTVTISPGIYMPNWNAAQGPEAYWSTPAVTGDGIEDFSMANGGSNGTVFDWSYGCWMSGVRSIEGGMFHVLLSMSAHDTVQGSYFYGTKNAATESYGVDESGGTGNLVQDNIFQHIVSGEVIDGSSVGSVVAYNYSIDDYFAIGPGFMMDGFTPHTAGVSFDLWEGNVGDGFVADDVHGPGYLWTLFRNRLRGYDLPADSQNDTTAVEIDAFHRFMNVVGNVLGYSGVSTTYQVAAPGGTNQDFVGDIYNLGWSNWAGWNVNDPLTVSTLFRWGNYDLVNNAAEWNPLEVPSSLSALANPVPTTETLPASFFLSSKPAWWITPWGTPPWPAIGPDVTGGTASSNGHAYATPAELCYENSPNDQNYPQDQSGLYVKLFNAGSCYGQPPAAPTGLTAAVQ